MRCWLPDANSAWSGRNDRCVADTITKRRDTKLAVGAAAVVVSIGLAIMAGIWLLLRSSSGDAPCSGRVVVGYAPNLLERASKEPFFQGGTRCGYWVTTRGGRLVAVQTTIAGERCTVAWSIVRGEFVCGGRRLAWSELRTFPSRVVRGGSTDKGWEIDFGP